MRQKTVFVILSWLSASAFLLGQALAQAPPAGQAQGPAQLDHNGDPRRRRRGREVDESLAGRRQQR